MKRKYLLVVILILICALLTGCGDIVYEEDPNEYGNWESYLDVPRCFPQSIETYGVNRYSYTLLALMDLCYEIFLDITVSDAQFEELIAAARACSEDAYEQDAYYRTGYREIVFTDHYVIHENYSETGPETVCSAHIEKVVYNVQTRNIVYVCFYASDSHVYRVDELQYFNRFAILPEEYAEHLD